MSLYHFVCYAAPSIPLLWLFRGYLKEESEGHTDAAAFCLFKNMGVKLVGRTDEGDVGGERVKQSEKRPMGSPQQLVHLIISADRSCRYYADVYLVM